MSGDYTRKTFDPRKQYVGVLMQQGRVQLDADWNEEQSIRQYRDETEARDVIGGCGAPLAGGGFALSSTVDGRDLIISPGRMYVDGILCELRPLPVPASLVASSSNQVQLESLYVDGYPLASGHWIELFASQENLLSSPASGTLLRIDEIDEENVRITIEGTLPDFSSPATDLRLRRVTTFLTQLDFPNPGIDGIAGSPLVPIASPPGDLALPAGVYLAYLDVWHREVTALDDPLIREVALGGPDTSTRLKTTCQVRLLSVAVSSPSAVACVTEFPEWEELILPSSGRLNARTRAPSPEEDPCQLAPSAGYRLLENQLYRVEIQDGGDRTQATFKWSRDNGSVETQIVEIDPADGRRVSVSTVGKDEVLGFQPGHWVEIIDDEAELKGNPHPLVQIDEVSPGEKLITLTTDISAHRGTARKLRRWDQGSSVNADGVISLTAGDAANEGWVELEGGIQIQFDEGTYRSGDFWLIPARTVTGEIEWPPFQTPNSHPIPQPPFGIHHHYCRLALIEVAADASLTIHDCRCRFPSLNQLQALHYVSGDGQEVMPTLPSTADAVVSLPQPLVVGIVNPQCREYPAMVRFTIIKGSGQLRSTDGALSGTQIELPASDDGIVECLWDLGADLTSDARREQNLPSQQVEARLLDETDEPIHLPIRFNANLSLAEQVAYDPQGCPNLDGDNTVQRAVAKLADIVSIAHQAGDGQVAVPGDWLANRIEVRVSNQCGALPAGLQVQFTPDAGGEVSADSPPTGSPSVTVDVGTDGIAGCFWRLNPATSQPSQQLTATLLNFPEDTLQGAAFVVITGNHSLSGTDPGMHVQQLRLNAGVELVNDTDVTADQLASGIQVICDTDIDQNSVRGKPVCFVTLELPYPFNSADFQLWGGGAPVFAFQPLVLGADTNSDNNVIFWTPQTQTQNWLRQQLFPTMAEFRRGDRVLARLTVQGNFIWSSRDPNLYLDGDVFGIRNPGTTNTSLRFDSGDDRRGGNLEMWFWLVATRNAPPTITPIADITILANQTQVVSFQVNDDETPAEQLAVSAVSSPPVLFLSLGSSGTNRTLTLVPATGQIGTARVTLTVTDSAGASQTTSFSVQVVPIVGVPTDPTVPTVPTVPGGPTVPTVPVPTTPTGPGVPTFPTGLALDETPAEAGRESKASPKRPRAKPKRKRSDQAKDDASGTAAE
ncbi:MAG: DUF6519 domain-containing protein [Verrucomicrobiales bacterium]|nr:DUF6519 domain-containing protein [Verrucomicrobiales bacterium]